MTELLTFEKVSKRFGRKLDIFEKIARTIGADIQAHTVHAVDHVSFSIHDGEVVGLVGESGCGKSTLGRLGCGLHTPTEGTVRYRGLPLETHSGIRRPIQLIFQDPFASLNPRMRVLDIVGEAPRVHGLIDRAEVSDYVANLLKQVGLDPTYMQRYPHQFSGGQRARIGIARALAVKPEFLVCDEAQFYTIDQCDQLAKVVDELGIDVYAFGLISDFRGLLFDGTKRLLEIADQRVEMQVEARCWCGSRANNNARLVNGVIVYEGETVVVGDTDKTTSEPLFGDDVRYELLCRKHYLSGDLGATQ